MKGIIFDMDGVLIDSEAGSFNVYRQILQEIGIEEDLEDMLTRYVGKTSRMITEDMMNRHQEADQAEVSKAFEKSRLQYYNSSDQVKPMEGLIDFLQRLKEHDIPAAVVSSTPCVQVITALNRMNITRYFSAVITGDMLTRSKPDPQGYQMAASFIQVPIEECVVVEDSRIGITGGRNANAYVVGYKGCTHKQDTSAADLEVYSFSELAERMDELFAAAVS